LKERLSEMNEGVAGVHQAACTEKIWTKKWDRDHWIKNLVTKERRESSL